MRRRFILLSLFCCYSPFLYSQNFDSLRNFHPLQIGNKWIYLHSEAYASYTPPPAGFTLCEITGDTVIDGRPYAVFFKTQTNVDVKSYEYLRWDSIKANIYAPAKATAEQLYDSLLCTNGSDSSERFSFASNKSDTVLGMTLPSRTVYFSANIDFLESREFAYGLGLINFGTEDYNGHTTNDEVVYADIAGKEYGTNVLEKVIDSLALYYPMHLGDEWTYRRIFSTSTRSDTIFIRVNVIGDTLLVNTYYRLFRQTDLSNNSTITFCARFDSTTGDLLRNDTVEDNAFVNSDYALFENESLQLNGISIVSILGLNTTKRSLLVSIKPGWFGRRDYGWNLGLVYSSYRWTTDSLETNELVYAKIANKEYGITAVQEVNNTSPSLFHLFQNYPNPFNPTTTIRYQLLTTSILSLKVYDILGREVAVLQDGMKAAGYYTDTFDASKLTSGFYFARLNAQTMLGKPFEHVIKMTLIK